ncbi:MAG: hypothetical protein ACI9DK_001645 [Vicingaceae bacterium]
MKHHLAITEARRESFGILSSSLVNENYQTKNSRCKQCFQIIEAPFSNYGSPQGIQILRSLTLFASAIQLFQSFRLWKSYFQPNLGQVVDKN